MTIYIHALAFRKDDPERNVRAIAQSARAKSMKAGDVMLLPFQALTGTVQSYWQCAEHNRVRNEQWLEKLAGYTKATGVRILLPAVLSEGVGVVDIQDGHLGTVAAVATEGGLWMKASESGLDYDVFFRSAAFGEPCDIPSASNLIVVDGQGFNEGHVYLGASKVVKSGRMRANFLLPQAPFTPQEGSVAWLDDHHLRFAAMQASLRFYMAECGFERVTIGLSGGLDSAVVCAVAVSVLGADKVNAYVLPSRFTSDGSRRDAQALADNLGIKLHEIDIMPTVTTVNDCLQPSIPYWADQSLMYENLQARVRGLMLMSLSNADGSLVINTGNKSELAVGYCTLYGDMVGGIALLADVYKSDLYRMCESVAWLRERIPANILKKAPTAELRSNQKDEDSLPSYETLDAVLKDLFEGGMNGKQLRKKHGSALAVRVCKLVMRARFKHLQAPMGVIMSPVPVKALPISFYEGLLPKEL